MESQEVTAKTVEEAIDLALKQLGVERDEVDVVVVAEGKSGILGIGGEPARIRVTSVEKIPRPAALARDILEKLIEYMEVDASVRLKEQETVGRTDDVSLALDISGDDSGLLIGRGGVTLSSLQFILNLMVSRSLESWAPINVDVEGYKQRRHRSLEALALRLAEKVKSSGRPFTLEPMSASERRIIHLALADNRYVVTESTGFGEGRRVSIRPVDRR